MWKIIFTVLAAVFAVGLGGLVGGYRDISVDDAGARDALNFAVVQHNKGTNDAFLRQAAEVVKVQSQVVAGIKYKISVRMARTSCRKGSVAQECPIHQDETMARPYQCTFTVWSRPWLGEIELLKEECS